MLMNELAQSIREETQGFMSSNFVPLIDSTENVPDVDDPKITYPNLVKGLQGVQALKSCVLYVDLRESTRLSAELDDWDLTLLYTSFIRAMVRCGNQFGGHVRNIIGDRVMVVFDQERCFTNSVNTAVLMHTVMDKVLREELKMDNLDCGIGIDYGEMIVAKSGIIKQGVENTSNKALVWLGRPANVASKLTDVANKPRSDVVSVALAPQPGSFNWEWKDIQMTEFLSNLETSLGRITHSNPSFASFLVPKHRTNPTILMTQEVYYGHAAESPDDNAVAKGLWRKTDVRVPFYSGDVFGGDIIYPSVG